MHWHGVRCHKRLRPERHADRELARAARAAASDPRIYFAVAFLLLAVAAAATWIPARRALRIDPAHALRAE
ncbi:MAG TPA: hypothetical protein VE620_04865 [Myxococcales bacterium]|nr:hypothetical protein [Myxococcales bacterium]